MLSLNSVGVSYGRHEVLRDITFDVAPGQKLAILGPNGCGKTTLLKSIDGLLEYTGEIVLFGSELRTFRRIELAREVALLSQNPTSYFAYTVYDTVAMGLYAQSGNRMFGSSRTASQAASVEAALEVTGLSDIRDQPINELSGGQAQRVFLARTIVQNPRVLLLDEPNNHLDIRYQLELLRYLDDWMDESRIIIGVFHDLNLALRFTTDVLVLADGRIAAYGNATEVLTRAFLQDVFAADVAGYLAGSGQFWLGALAAPDLPQLETA